MFGIVEAEPCNLQLVVVGFFSMMLLGLSSFHSYAIPYPIALIHHSCKWMVCLNDSHLMTIGLESVNGLLWQLSAPWLLAVERLRF